MKETMNSGNGTLDRSRVVAPGLTPCFNWCTIEFLSLINNYRKKLNLKKKNFKSFLFMEIKNRCGHSFTHVRPTMILWFEPRDGNGVDRSQIMGAPARPAQWKLSPIHDQSCMLGQLIPLCTRPTPRIGVTRPEDIYIYIYIYK